MNNDNLAAYAPALGQFGRRNHFEVVGAFSDNVNSKSVRGRPTNFERNIRSGGLHIRIILCDKTNAEKMVRPKKVFIIVLPKIGL